MVSVARPAVAEGVGTAFLLCAVVGSGIMGERLAGGNVAIALLANTLATGAALVALILTFGTDLRRPSQSRGDARRGVARRPAVAPRARLHRCAGRRRRRPACGPRTRCSTSACSVVDPWPRRASAALQRGRRHLRPRSSVIWGCGAQRPDAVPFAVAAYITAAYWFTAVHVVRQSRRDARAQSLTDTFAGIRPADAPGFIVAQLCGAAAATLLFRWLAR